MDYEIKIAVNPEVDVEKLNKIVKSIDEKFSSFKKIELFDAKSVDEILKKIPQKNELTVPVSDINPSSNTFIGLYEQNLRSRKEEELYSNELMLQQKLIDEEKFLANKLAINKKYVDDLNAYLESTDIANNPVQQLAPVDPLKLMFPGRTYYTDETQLPDYVKPDNPEDLEIDHEEMELSKFNKNSLQYAEGRRKLDLKRAKEAYEKGLKDLKEFGEACYTKEDYDEEVETINHDYEFDKTSHPFYLKELEIKADDSLSPMQIVKKVYENNKAKAKAWLKAKLIDKEDYKFWLEDFKEIYENDKWDIINPEPYIEGDAGRDEWIESPEEGELQSLNRISNNFPFMMDDRDLDIESIPKLNVKQVNESIANLKNSLAEVLAERNELISVLNAQFSEGSITPRNYDRKYKSTIDNYEGTISSLQKQINEENKKLALALSQNDEVQKKIGELEEIYNDRIDTVLAGALDAQNPQVLAAIADIEFQKQLEFYRAKLITADQYNESVKSIRAKLNEDKKKVSQKGNINNTPPKMMMSDIELDAIYAEFEGDNENYRDEELSANQKMLDDKLIAEEQFLENRLRILQDFETRKKEVLKYIDNVDSLSTSDTTNAADSTDTSDSDSETEVVKKTTEKPAKVFDAMHELIADRSHSLKTATTNLTKSIAETLGGLFDGNEDKLKEGSKKLLKTLAELIKKVASAAITNIVIGQLGISGATTGLGAIFGAPAILALVQGVVSAIIDPIVNSLVMKTGGRADVPTGVIIGDNPYSPEWVLRDFDIQAIIDTALQKAFKATSSEMDKSNDIQSELIEIIKTQERYSQANNFFNTGETVMLQVPEKQGSIANAIYIDNTQIIKNLEQLNEQFSNFEGRIHVVESEVAQATNNFNNRINRRSFI